MSELKGLNAGIRPLVSDINFRNGSQSAVEYEQYLVDLALARDISLDPLKGVITAAMRRYDPEKSDAWLAPRVHATLRLTRREAGDKRVWAYLNVAVFPDYVRWRWRDSDEDQYQLIASWGGIIRTAWPGCGGERN
jgi:hypothetical protein